MGLSGALTHTPYSDLGKWMKLSRTLWFSWGPLGEPEAGLRVPGEEERLCDARRWARALPLSVNLSAVHFLCAFQLHALSHILLSHIRDNPVTLMICRSGDCGSERLSKESRTVQWASFLHLQFTSRSGWAERRSVWARWTAFPPEARKPEGPAKEWREARRPTALNGACFVVWRC